MIGLIILFMILMVLGFLGLQKRLKRIEDHLAVIRKSLGK